MEKQLDEMNGEELGRLFPIILSEHDPMWHDLYLSEKNTLEKSINLTNIIRINHYGSTSVCNLRAKPTIDILLEIQNHMDTEKIISLLKGIGYNYSLQPNNPAPHMMFMKGYTPSGFSGQAYHLHVRYSGDWDELYFRDYLILYPEIAEKYGELKLQLKQKYEFDREGYTSAKSNFIKNITEQARKEFGKRY
ncbi:GrpB family protein [Clostridium tagluense]|uniref:GrpB family protein n=1 Tax=Clostridium tagluense TaxID=360422 RepID=UPI001C0D4214|nr:GrpB family protein [Clostridium tagluense]MBU3128684.1 GrpB family protein [Clostridium tagluense]MCB2312801.1 GrpB family protein [Clostridium tagluense]MCB2317567.1 GrpB family protein [Clostridium tagluense]MCB2322343.1 GrpB family protein [Clostridium tagluense]MCB2327346.1 GrpB family protein [Clostridium tagluense]